MLKRYEICWVSFWVIIHNENLVTACEFRHRVKAISTTVIFCGGVQLVCVHWEDFFNFAFPRALLQEIFVSFLALYRLNFLLSTQHLLYSTWPFLRTCLKAAAEFLTDPLLHFDSEFFPIIYFLSTKGHKWRCFSFFPTDWLGSSKRWRDHWSHAWDHRDSLVSEATLQKPFG